METALILLSILALFQFIFNLSLLAFLKKLKQEKNLIEKEKESMINLLPGDRVIFEEPLIWKKTIKFTALYEATVVEVSEKVIKVNAYNFVTDNTLVLQDKSASKQIIDFMQDKWVEREKISQMIGKQFIRDKKINEVLK